MKRRGAFLVVLLLLGAFLITETPTHSATDKRVWVHFINVGQGDAILIRDALGTDVLVDGGKRSAGQIVLDYLRQENVDDIDVMIATHADSDHIGGLISVLSATDIPVRAVLYNGYPGSTQTWADFVSAVSAEGVLLEAAQYPAVYQWGNITAYVLNPVAGLSNPDQNNASVVLLIDTGGVEFLLTGDLETSNELSVAGRGIPYWNGVTCCVDVLKVAHHGSKYSTSIAFLQTVQPDEAVISVGNNSYGHPAPETIARLLQAGARIWRTDQNGTVIIVGESMGYQITTTPPSQFFAFLPLIMRQIPPTATPTPSPSPPPTSTPTPAPMFTPTPTFTPVPGNTGLVKITSIFYNGVGNKEPDEFVEIKNNDTISIQLQGWTLRDAANHIFVFPNFVISPGQTCRVYTNEYHPEWCGFNYGSNSAIWNNSGDCATIKDAQGNVIDQYCYP